MAEFGLSLPIPITIISGNLFAEGIPRLKPIDFLHYMSETGNLYRLLGGTSLDKSAAKLTEFWGNFQKIHPDFELFSADTPKKCSGLIVSQYTAMLMVVGALKSPSIWCSIGLQL